MALRFMMRAVLPFLAALGAASAATTPENLEQVLLFHRHGDRSFTACLANSPGCGQYWADHYDGFGQLTPRGMYQLHRLGTFMRTRYADSGFIGGNYSRADVYVRSTDYDRTLQSVTSLLQGLFPKGTGPAQFPNGGPGLTSDFLQPVPIRTLPEANDGLLRAFSGATCPEYANQISAHLSSIQSTVDEKEKEYGPLLTTISEKTGNATNLMNLWRVMDTLNVMREHPRTNITFPLSDQEFDEAVLLTRWVEYQQYFSTSELARFAGGAMVCEIRNRLLARVFAMTQPWFSPSSWPSGFGGNGPRLAVFSAHDMTLNSLLFALGAYDAPFQNPPYGSSVAVELVRTSTESVETTSTTEAEVTLSSDSEDDTGLFSDCSAGLDLSAASVQQKLAGYSVRVFFNRGVGTAGSTGITYPQRNPFESANNITYLFGDCNTDEVKQSSLCPLSTFLDATTDKGVSNWVTECSLAAPPSTNTVSESTYDKMKDIAIGGWVVAGVLVIIGITMTARRQKSESSSGYRLQGV